VTDVNPVHHGYEPEATDAEIEAIVAEAIAADAALARREASPPSSAIVWWRAQMRARQEAARAVERPIVIVHALAIAAGAGLMLGVLGYAVAATRVSAGWLAAIDLTSPWVTVPMSAMLVSALVASVAAYFIFADE
jgi:uncharacterized membrane protein YecN with MAPEG domain